MKRILLIVAMLLPVVSAIAVDPNVTITADVNTATHLHDGVPHKTVTIGYTSDVNVRAFALDINVSTNMNIGANPPTGFLRGESISPNKGYGIFPGRFRDFINPSVPDWDDANYMPITPLDDPGAENTGLDKPRMVVELGTLYSGDANRPALSGTLFTFDVNSEGNSGGTVTIDTEDLRGEIVGTAGTALTDNLPITVNLNFPVAGCPVPNCVGQTSEWCIAAIGTAGFANWKEYGVPGNGQAGQELHKVIAQLQTPGSSWPCDTRIDFNEVNWPVKPTAPFYANWINRGRPQCWAYPRQCRGDADGKKEGTFWVSNNDILIFRTAFNQLATAIPPGGICADFDHKKEGTFWVSNNDILIFRNYFNQLATSVPLCGNVLYPCSDPNYHYWCLPAGVTCPAGQYCAPAGVCPNSP